MPRVADVKIVNVDDEGHRRELMDLLRVELRSQGIEPEVVPSIRPLEPSPVLFALIEDSTARFIFTAALRGLAQQTTVGLLFRPGQCFRRKSLRHAFKRLALMGLSRLSTVQILTILPHALDPRFASVSTGWIYDPQLWDLDPLGRVRLACTSTLTEDIKRSARGKRIVVALGSQSFDKGFDFLASTAASPAFPRDRYFIVVAGNVASTSRAAARRLGNTAALIIDRRISDAELLELYSVADLVWSCYAPDYDQASGIFGRAVQLGVPTIVRTDSYLERLAHHLEHPAISIDFAQPEAAARALARYPETSLPRDQRSTEHMRKHSLRVLKGALGLVREHDDRKRD
jgi:hypothetical protein